MLYFLGNCQADFVSEVLTRSGYDCTHRVLASPMTYSSHPEAIPSSLAQMVSQYELDAYFLGRDLTNQYAPVETDAELIVINLHHELSPLFIHQTEQYVFYVAAQALSERPDFMQWAQANCRMFQPNPATYLRRFGEMLHKLRERTPEVPIVILSRLDHHPAFGPDPYSYLEEWGTLSQTAHTFFTEWTTTLSDVHLLDMNNVFGGIWREHESRIESYCPFFKIQLEEADGRITGLHAQRDIEHIGPMPERLAEKIEAFLKTHVISYTDTETPVPEWNQPWQPSPMEPEALLSKLGSGANYEAAEAVGAFFLDLQSDYTSLLVEAAPNMPVCHNTLHMIKAYSRITSNPALAAWCDAHIETAKRFTANGSLYQRDYIQRVLSIRQAITKK